MKLHRIPGGSV
uniref:Uncharacterized protein n=1 Tax=Anguilla anguilla TaxID=7936 RepID=A0A0E9SEE9_ANGAN